MVRIFQMNSSKSKNLRRLLIVLPAGIFLSEVIAMILVYFNKGPYWITILLDAAITTTLMLPLIYILSYRPLLNHIAEKDRVERIMEVRLRLMEYSFIHTVDELLQVTLDELEAITGSSIGFFHFLESDQKTLQLQAWSTNTLQNMCKAEGKGSHYSVDQAGVWADCVRQRQPVIHNDYASLLHRTGTPDGHAPIIREMSVPILRNDQVVAILGMGNKPRDFTASDVELVSTLADFAWDIIERKRAEDALRKSEEKFRTLVDWTYDCEQWVDPQGNIVYISPSCERISGWSPEEFRKNSNLLTNIVHLDDLQSYEEHKQLVHDETAGISNIEYRIINRDGSEHWIEHICRPLFGKDNRYLGRRISNRDITARKRAEKEIWERSQKENLLIQTIHNMKLEIARDLHDTIGQNISYLRMKLDFLSEIDLKTHDDTKTEIENMVKVANDSFDLIRGTLVVLQSGNSEDPLNLFKRYAEQVAERSSLEIKFSNTGSPKQLSLLKLRQLFFIFREALSNIEKYALANQVFVEFKWHKNYLYLEITDNGIGFDQQTVKSNDHYGLKFMEERTHIIDGSFIVQSELGQGTKIKIRIPCLDELLISIGT